MTICQLVAHFRGPSAMGRGRRARHHRGHGLRRRSRRCPDVLIGGVPARLASASPHDADRDRAGRPRRRAHAGPDRRSARRDGLSSRSARRSRPACTRSTAPRSTRDGNLYVTFSGSRGQQAPVAIFIVRPDGSREPFVSDLANPTSLAFDPDGRLHVSSRFDGSVHRVDADGRVTTVATDLGVACGIAFRPDGTLYVGDRSGSILRVARRARDGRSRRMPASVAAFHLAFGPDGWLYVTAPTLGARDCVYRVSPDGLVEVFYDGLRPPAGPGLRLARAICTSSTRSRARAASIACALDRPVRARAGRRGRLAAWGSRSIRAAGSSWRRATRCSSCRSPVGPLAARDA